MANNSDPTVFSDELLRQKHYKDLVRKNIFRLSMTYLAPLVLIIFFAQYEYSKLLKESRELHMSSTVEQQANILDLFLKERLVNLVNLIDDPRIRIPPNEEQMSQYLQKLKRDSETFIDIDFFDTAGVRIAYAGPMPMKERKDYSAELWYSRLKGSNKRYIITDIYLGFRKKPHFTIAASRIVDGRLYVLRAALDPTKIHEYISTFSGAGDLRISIVNHEGFYQVVDPEFGSVLEKSPFAVSGDLIQGLKNARIDNKKVNYAYHHLSEVNWSVVVSKEESGDGFLGMQADLLIISLALVMVLLFVIIFRSRKIALTDIEKAIVRTQLEHASKLASVGELASGIAHEINNPLAIIASESGLMMDLMDPELSSETSFEDLKPHIGNIKEAAFRCRDITRKLLSFVRQDDIVLKKHNIHDIINDIVDGFYDRSLAVSNVELVKKFGEGVPSFITDSNQIRQVLLNIINNAFDAIAPPGKIVISTSYAKGFITVSVSDTGTGISQEIIDKIFLPFFTTKEVGKGTGLGLSVSYGIVKGMGGTIEVESIVGKGTTFIIKLPAQDK
jgi:two-component system NtrC family sensor kinase